jgi:GDP-L-fucose synthase
MTNPPPGHYLIFGASGLVGSHLLHALRDRPEVTVTAVGGSRPPQVTGANITPRQTDLTERQACEALMAGADYLVLAAGVLSTAPVLKRDPLASVLTTQRIAVNTLETAWRAGIKHAVLLSSTTGYPEGDAELSEEQMFKGEPPAGWHALGWMTRYVETLAQSVALHVPRPMPVTVLRPSLIYGEYDHFDEASAHFLPSLVRRVVHRETPIEVWGNGTQTRDVIHAADVAAACLRGLAHPEPFAAFNIAAGASYSVNDILARLVALDDFSDAQIVHRLDKPQSTATRRFDVSLAREVLGFSPSVSLDEGLRRTIAWYRHALAANQG